MTPDAPASPQCPLHHQPARGTCARCGAFICAMCTAGSPDGVHCESCRLGAVERQPTPWERRGELGLATAFVQQLKLSCLQPAVFWRMVRPEGSLTEALSYSWLVAALAAPLNFLNVWFNFGQMQRTLSALKGFDASTLERFSGPGFAAALAFLPLIIYPLSFFLNAGMVHVGCVLWGAGKNGFNATARAMAFGHGPILLGGVPGVGPFIALYAVVLQVWGLQKVQESTVGKAIGGYLTLPLALGCCASVGIIMAVAATLSRLH